MAEITIQQRLQEMVGQPAWGLCRTIGSCFFLEVGKIKYRPGEKSHGEWHFLIEMLSWKFEKNDEALASSSDSQAHIDKVFEELELGFLKGVSIKAPSNCLMIQFSSGIDFSSFSEASEENEKQWILYCPDDTAWISDTLGSLENKSIFS